MPSATSSSPVLDAERRAWSYWFVDGLPNLLTGVLCLLLAGCFVLLSYHSHARSPVVITLAALAIVIYIVVFVRLRQTLEWLKSRITYPRTGYTTPPYFTYTNDTALPPELTMLTLSNVAEKEATDLRRAYQDQHRRVWLFVAVLAAAVISTMLIQNRWFCGVAGVVVGLGIWLSTRKDERMSWVVAVGLPFAGMYMLMFPGPDAGVRIERLGFFLGGIGFVLALTGAIALVRYLRGNPVARA